MVCTQPTPVLSPGFAGMDGAVEKGLSEFLCSRLCVGPADSDEAVPHIKRQVV